MKEKTVTKYLFLFHQKVCILKKKNSLEENKKTFGLYILAFKYYFRKY